MRAGIVPDPRVNERENLKVLGSCHAWLNNPFPSVENAPRLSASVGERQPNLSGDVRTVQMLLNKLIGNQYLIVDAGVLVIPPRVPVSGKWDRWTSDTVKIIERRYFNGMAHPLGVITPQGSFFRFLVEVIAQQRVHKMRLAPEMHKIAALMVPGGIGTLSGPGRSQIAGDETMDRITGYLPLILNSLDNFNLADTNMVLMALATIRAETTRFVPAREGRSALNTTPDGTPGHHLFDKYDHKIGNKGEPDGERYRGRGFIQLTGRANYESIGRQIGKDLVNDPDAAYDPDTAALILAVYLKNKETQIRSAIKKNDLAHARRLVNGGSNGLAEFIAAFEAGRRYVNQQIIQNARHRSARCQ